MKKVQTSEQHRYGQPRPRLIEITERKSGMTSRAALQSIPIKRTSTVGQPWEPGGGAIQGQTITSALIAHN